MDPRSALKRTPLTVHGSCVQITNHVREVSVGRHRVRRLMRLLGLEAIYRKPRTTLANPDHRVYPYLLRGVRNSTLLAGMAGWPHQQVSTSPMTTPRASGPFHAFGNL